MCFYPIKVTQIKSSKLFTGNYFQTPQKKKKTVPPRSTESFKEKKEGKSRSHTLIEVIASVWMSL
jgi:hypothetical protein